MSITRTIKVLIPDGEAHVLLYVVNCLSLKKHIKIYVMSSKEDGYMKYSRYIEKYIYQPEVSPKKWIKCINKTVDKHNIDLVMPIYEAGIAILAERINEINIPKKICGLPNAKNLHVARNKGLLYLHLKDWEIPCPRSIVVNSIETLDAKTLNLNYPLIIKPVEGGGGGKGICIVENEEKFIRYCKNYNGAHGSIIQEYILGDDFCCNVLCKEGEIIAYSIQKATDFRSGELTPQIAFDFIENKELFENAKKLMKSLNYSGVANIDWRYDREQKKFKVIEINPRFWLGTDASLITGVNFPYLYCLSSLGYQTHYKTKVNISYLSLEGLVKRFKKNPFYTLNLSYIYQHSPIRFILRDPLPILYKAFLTLRGDKSKS
ncbi:Predicted ATP-dependent carboligase, ATP-grasp superfamily [Hyunsoonleella jejuensis]|uniref:Predicted ATP-dependent carboligase, ATP-grasp superfamily n=1 Tax=Hyunsoonleella jejuensis TaxID=419940 RepID=A0A1H9GBH1_9FLAO|nr:ATP-grasp domain-containing protein [Hyunsoonleella jejuensis]SEQ47410.1 Predicted ATP-dependent carboligase, ATP-grasp superfamily [Hyunsoonleella jejuensis]